MFLPPNNAYLREYKMTYGEVRGRMIAQSRAPAAQAAAARGEAVVFELTMPAGCNLGVSTGGLPDPSSMDAAASASVSASVARHVDSGARAEVYPTYASLRSGIRVMDSCLTGQIYCWHQCDDISAYNLTCPISEVTCVGPDGQPADPDLHNPANQPGCVGQAYVDPGGFCTGSGVSMYMEGFISYVTGEYRTKGGSHTPSCLVLWFPDWIIDTQGALVCLFFTSD